MEFISPVHYSWIHTLYLGDAEPQPGPEPEPGAEPSK